MDHTTQTKKTDERLAIERARLEIEKSKVKFDQRFSNKYLALIVAAIVPLTVAVFSYFQAAKEQGQKEKELNMLEVQQNREWNLSVAKFVSEHADVIFGTDDERRARIREVMLVTFPPNITSIVFQKLEATAASPEAKRTWQDPLQTITFNRSIGVWVNTGSGVYHCPGSQWFMKTSQGTLMSQQEALAKGYRPAYDNLCQ